MARRGLAAVLIDGPCRDSAQIAPMAIPIYGAA
jgi:regulator of RNase E activity RraA